MTEAQDLTPMISRCLGTSDYKSCTSPSRNSYFFRTTGNLFLKGFSASRQTKVLCTVLIEKCSIGFWALLITLSKDLDHSFQSKSDYFLCCLRRADRDALTAGYAVEYSKQCKETMRSCGIPKLSSDLHCMFVRPTLCEPKKMLALSQLLLALQFLQGLQGPCSRCQRRFLNEAWHPRR